MALSVASTVVLLRAGGEESAHQCEWPHRRGLAGGGGSHHGVGVGVVPAFANIVQPSGQQTADIPGYFHWP